MDGRPTDTTGPDKAGVTLEVIIERKFDEDAVLRKIRAGDDIYALDRDLILPPGCVVVTTRLSPGVVHVIVGDHATFARLT